MKILRRICVFIVTFILVMLIIEVYLKFSEIVSTDLYELHDTFGRQYRPGHNLSTFTEGFSISTINDYGYLGPGYPEEKPAGTIRIALLGDSFVQGFEVFGRYHHRTVIEQKLRKTFNTDAIEVMNFGRDSFDIYEMKCYYDNFVKEFNPDFTVFIVSYNDFVQNRFAFHPDFIYLDDKILLDDRFKDTSTYKTYTKTIFFTQRFRTIKMLKNSISLISTGKFLPIVLGKFFKRKPRYDWESLVIDTDKVKIIPAILDELAKEENVYLVDKNEFTFKENILKLIRERNIKFYDPEKEFQALRDQGIHPNYWKVTNKTGHWNHHGHAVIGNYIADMLTPEIKKVMQEQGQ